jgi:hypothetical protein
MLGDDLERIWAPSDHTNKGVVLPSSPPVVVARGVSDRRPAPTKATQTTSQFSIHKEK